jgi:hypothetical protein
VHVCVRVIDGNGVQERMRVAKGMAKGRAEIRWAGRKTGNIYEKQKG